VNSVLKRCNKAEINSQYQRLENINRIVIVSIPAATFIIALLLIGISVKFGAMVAAKWGFLIGLLPNLYGTAGTVILAIALKNIKQTILNRSNLRYSYKMMTV